MPVLVGRLGRAHGLRGEIAVEVRTDVPEVRFAPGSVLRCSRSAERPESVEPDVQVAEARVHSGRLLLTLVGVSDRTAAEPLNGLYLFADAPVDEAAEDEEEYFDRQLIGLRVVGDDSAQYGSIVDVAHLPGQDLLVVQTADAEDQVLVPFVGEIVASIDLEAGVAVIDPPAGLFSPEPTD